MNPLTFSNRRPLRCGVSEKSSKEPQMDLLNYNEEVPVGLFLLPTPPGILLGLAEYCLEAGLLALGRNSSRGAFFLQGKAWSHIQRQTVVCY